MALNTNRLVVLNLQHDYRATSLNSSVYADLALQVLHYKVRNKDGSKASGLKRNEIAKSISYTLNIKRVSDSALNDAITGLKKDGKIVRQDDKWLLDEEAATEMDEKLAADKQLIKSVIRRHFPSDIKPKDLQNWFYTISAKVFSEFGDDIVANISAKKKHNGRINIEQLVKSSAKKHNLQPKFQPLLKGYIDFLSGDTPEDLRLITQLCTSGFAARLVAAQVAADPASLEKLEGAILVLDTNVLFNMKLRTNVFAKSMVALGEALEEIGVKLVYITPTKEEYAYTVAGNIKEVLEVVDKFHISALKKLEVDDDFLAAALDAGCKDYEDFKSFFDELAKLPEQIEGGPKVKYFADDVTEKIIENAENDERLKKQISSKRVSFERPKGNDYSLSHDAAFLRVSESTVEGVACWGITMDNALKSVAIDSAGKSLPRVMGLETLIEMLAVNKMGPRFDPTDFAPLLASILKNHCLPAGGSQQIKIKDLRTLSSVRADAGNLPHEEIEELTNFVVNVRIQDKKFTNPEVQREFSELQGRMYVRYDEKLDEQKAKTAREAKLRRDAEDTISEQTRVIEQLKEIAISGRADSILRELRRSLAKSLFVRAAGIIMLTIIVSIFSNWVFIEDTTISSVIGVLISMAALWKWIIEPVKTYRIQKSHCREKASEEIKTNH